MKILGVLVSILLASPAFGQPGSQPVHTVAEVMIMSQSTAPGGEMAEPDAEVSEKLQQYDQTRLPLTLKEAADAAALHDGQAPPDPALGHALGRQRVAGWLAILAHLKRDLDPAFDPEDKPTVSVIPPGKDGNQYAPGVNPKDVKDPVMREAYIAAIEKNDERIQSYSKNVKLFQAHRIIMERAAPSIADARTTLGLSPDEIVAMLNAADITQADRDALLHAIQ
jgi:hypothetical protein